jgi:hypothetical protein
MNNTTHQEKENQEEKQSFSPQVPGAVFTSIKLLWQIFSNSRGIIYAHILAPTKL